MAEAYDPTAQHPGFADTVANIAGGYSKPLERDVTIWVSNLQHVVLDAIFAYEADADMCDGCGDFMLEGVALETCRGVYCPACDRGGWVGACCAEHFGKGSDD